MRRRRRMDDDDEYPTMDTASGGIMQLTEDLLTESEKRKFRAKLRQKPVRPVGFAHPGERSGHV